MRHSSVAFQNQSTDSLRKNHAGSLFPEYASNRPIEAIDDRVLKDFVPWRRSYRHGKPELPRNAKLNPTEKTLLWDVILATIRATYINRR